MMIIIIIIIIRIRIRIIIIIIINPKATYVFLVSGAERRKGAKL